MWRRRSRPPWLSRSRQGELAATLNVRVLSVRDGRARVVLSNRVGSLTETGGAAAVLERGQWRISEFPGQETAGRYLVVGDDRAQSADSREWGPVRTAWIVGKLARVVR
jgi:hypothetical protein